MAILSMWPSHGNSNPAACVLAFGSSPGCLEHCRSGASLAVSASGSIGGRAAAIDHGPWLKEVNVLLNKLYIYNNNNTYIYIYILIYILIYIYLYIYILIYILIYIYLYIISIEHMKSCNIYIYNYIYLIGSHWLQLCSFPIPTTCPL